MNNSIGETALQSIQSPQKIQMIRASQLSITDLKVKWTLHFASASYTVKNSIRSTSAINSVSMVKYRRSPLTNGKPCIVLPQLDTLGCQQKEMARHKGKSMIHAFYILWYAKRYISGRSGV